MTMSCFLNKNVNELYFNRYVIKEVALIEMTMSFFLNRNFHCAIILALRLNVWLINVIKYDLSDKNWDKANYEFRLHITTCNYT